jgi:hypothetical protein
MYFLSTAIIEENSLSIFHGCYLRHLLHSSPEVAASISNMVAYVNNRSACINNMEMRDTGPSTCVCRMSAKGKNPPFFRRKTDKKEVLNAILKPRHG